MDLSVGPTWQSKDDDLLALHQLLEVDLLGLIAVIEHQQLGVRVQGQLGALLDRLGLLDCRGGQTQQGNGRGGVVEVMRRRQQGKFHAGTMHRRKGFIKHPLLAYETSIGSELISSAMHRQCLECTTNALPMHLHDLV